MTLAQYLKQHDLKAAEFGRQVGVEKRQTMHKYVHGTRFPNPDVLRRIREVTNGAVTADDFVDQHAGEAA